MQVESPTGTKFFKYFNKFLRNFNKSVVVVVCCGLCGGGFVGIASAYTFRHDHNQKQ